MQNRIASTFWTLQAIAYKPRQINVLTQDPLQDHSKTLKYGYLLISGFRVHTEGGLVINLSANIYSDLYLVNPRPLNG